MKKLEPTVFVVDDDEAVRSSLRWLLSSDGLKAVTYSSAREFLESYDPEVPGCLLLDIRMPEMNGLELQDRLVTQKISIPVIIITGHGDVQKAVRAMKTGALDVLSKPFNDQVILDRVHQAIEMDLQARQEAARRAEVAGCLDQLTKRERTVLDMVVAGMANKQIAADLGISPKTVEVHRAHVMEKMQAKSLAELVSMVLMYEKRTDKPWSQREQLC